MHCVNIYASINAFFYNSQITLFVKWLLTIHSPLLARRIFFWNERYKFKWL